MLDALRADGVGALGLLWVPVSKEGPPRLSSAQRMADSAKLHIEAVKPEKLRVMGLLIIPRC